MNIKNVAILSLALFFYSCSDDSESSSKDASLLLGEWDVLTYELYDCENENNDFLSDCSTGSGANCAIYQFLEDGVFNYIIGSFQEEGTYQVYGDNNRLLLIQYGSSEYRGGWSVSGNSLILDDTSSTVCKLKIDLEKVL